MRGVDQAPAAIDGRICEKPFDRARAVGVLDFLDFFDLLRDVDVNRPVAVALDRFREVCF